MQHHSPSPETLPRPLPRWPWVVLVIGLSWPPLQAALWPALRLAGSLLVVLMLGLAALAATVLTLIQLRYRRWRCALVYLALPLGIVAAVAAPAPVTQRVWHLSDLLRLRVHQHKYEAERAASATGPVRYQEIDWSMGALFGDTFLIYDESDHIALPDFGGAAYPDGAVSEKCAGSVEPLYGHYYLCNF